MEDPKIKTRVAHSNNNPAWNVIGTETGRKHKIAIVPYFPVNGNDLLTEKNKNEALIHANFINECFNKSDKIILIK